MIEKINSLQKDINKIYLFLYKRTKCNYKDHQYINNKIFKVKQQLLHLKIANYNKELHSSATLNYKKKLKLLSSEINDLDKYHSNILKLKKKKALDILTIINTIFLPLTFITGYFGMNFNSMSNINGIFRIKSAETFLFFIFFLTTSIILYFFKKYYYD